MPNTSACVWYFFFVLALALAIRVSEFVNPTFCNGETKAAAEKDSLYFGWKANFSVIRALLQGTVQAQKQLQRPSYPFLVMVSPTL